MSRKGIPNKKSKISYPRKCNHCDYISNNPSMHHYHKKVHEEIPANQFCDHGCGNLAKFCNTNGKYTCHKVAHRCPAYISKHSDRVKEQWKNAHKRKEETKKSLIERLHQPAVVEKMKETKRRNTGLITPEDIKEYRHYARRIRQQANAWARECGYDIGHQTYHVDHKFSILDSWHAKLSIDIVNHPANLQIITAKENLSKGRKSSITKEELLYMVESS